MFFLSCDTSWCAALSLQLSLPGITVQSLSVQSGVSRAVDELYTMWQETDLDVALGLDFTPPGSMFGRFKHLQHERFTYTIQVRGPFLRWALNGPYDTQKYTYRYELRSKQCLLLSSSDSIHRTLKTEDNERRTPVR